MYMCTTLGRMKPLPLASYVTQIEGVTIGHLLQKVGFSLKHSLQLNFCEYLWHLNTLFVRFVCLIYSDILKVCTVDLEFGAIQKG